ncbi:5308_t:CDS:1, partial [Racocetra persica]
RHLLKQKTTWPNLTNIPAQQQHLITSISSAVGSISLSTHPVILLLYNSQEPDDLGYYETIEEKKTFSNNSKYDEEDYKDYNEKDCENYNKEYNEEYNEKYNEEYNEDYNEEYNEEYNEKHNEEYNKKYNEKYNE